MKTDTEKWAEEMRKARDELSAKMFGDDLFAELEWTARHWSSWFGKKTHEN